VSENEPVVVEPATASAAEPVVATTDPAAVETDATYAEDTRYATGQVEPVAAESAQPDHRVVYVDAPVPPRKKGNRGVGALIAIAAAVVFAAIYALIIVIVDGANNVALSPTFLAAPAFWVPVLFFAVGFVILVLIVNRANWWVHVIGSLFVALFVYFGSVGTLVLINGIVSMTPESAGSFIRAVFISPGAIAAALLAREVALWAGFGIAARGRRVKARNVIAREEFDRELATTRAERERPAVADPVAE
jgi:hypothetical protein